MKLKNNFNVKMADKGFFKKIKNSNFGIKTPLKFNKSTHYVIGDHSEKKDYTKSAHTENTHWGQLKLFVSELVFLTHHYNPSGASDVVYIGAAPGDHIRILSVLFPSITFHLYDASDFKPEVHNNARIKIYKRYFGENDIAEWKSKRCFLISDIRTTSYDSKKTKLTDIKNNEDIVWKDMNLQRRWVEEIEPVYSLLKFRLPYAEKFELKKGKTRKYLDGTVYIQSFCKPLSSETRLCVAGDQIGERDWDILDYEKRLFFHNTERRHKHIFVNPIHDEDLHVYPEIGLFNDYDSVHLTNAVIDYLRKINRSTSCEEVKKLLKIIVESVTTDSTKLLKIRDC